MRCAACLSLVSWTVELELHEPGTSPSGLTTLGSSRGGFPLGRVYGTRSLSGNSPLLGQTLGTHYPYNCTTRRRRVTRPYDKTLRRVLQGSIASLTIWKMRSSVSTTGRAARDALIFHTETIRKCPSQTRTQIPLFKNTS